MNTPKTDFTQHFMKQTVSSPCLSNDPSDLLRVTRLVLERCETDELRKQIIDLLQSIFKADAANFFLATDDGRLSFETVVSNGIEEKWHSDFRRHYHRYDPFRNGIRYPSVCTLEQVISYQELLKGSYYNDFLKPQSIHSELCVYLRSGRQLLGLIALFRPIRKPIFSIDEKEKAYLMAPYLSKALEISVVAERDARSQCIVNSLAFEIEGKGIILLNEHYEIIYMDNTAREIIPLLSDNEVTAGIEHRSLPDRLLRCLLDSRSQDTGSGVYDLMTKEAKLHVCVKVKHEVSAGKAVYKLILKPEKSLLLARSLLASGLTARQSEVTVLVCNGLSNSEISEKLCISEYTVENHLRHIYEKMHVKNRTSLAHVVLSQSPTLV
jgi:DNA-binding CsgD family transcriptional regulator/PAS domain-containing protein